MAERLISIVVPPGQTEQVDPRVLDPQALQKAQNVRLRKDGRAAKKYGNQAISTSGIFTDSTREEFTNALLMHRGGKVLINGARVFSHFGGSSWRSNGNVSAWLPGRSESIRRTEASAQPKERTLAVCQGKIVYAWTEGNSGTTLNYLVTRASSGATISVGPYTSKDVLDIPRAVAVGSTVYIVCREFVLADVYIIPVDCSADAVTPGTSNNFANLNSTTGRLDAAPYSSTEWLLAYQSAGTTITVALMSGTTAVQTQTITTTGEASAICVYGTSGENIYVAFVDSDGALKVRAYNSTLTTATSTLTTIATDTQYGGHQPTMLRLTSSSVTLVWGGFDATNVVGFTQWTQFFSSGSFGSPPARIYGVRPASKLFGTGADDNFAHVWLHTDNSGPGTTDDWEIQKTYFVAQLVNGLSVSKRAIYQMNGAPLVPSDGDGFVDHLTDVVTDGTTHYTCLQNVLRRAFGASDDEMVGLEAMSFYSFEAGLRYAYRAFAPAGPATYFAGGRVTDFHGRIAIESGFAHYPVIKSAVASAGGSMGTGSYSYVAVIEYVDDVGRRHRSAPSGPVLVQTTAGNNKVTLTIHTLALAHENDQRVISGTIASRVIHVYRTAVGGSGAHYRITSNTGALVAVADNITGVAATVTLVDEAPDSDLDSEIVYTDGGVLPNLPPPACRYIANVRGRLVLGGLFVPHKIVVSKLLVEGEPAQFSDSDAFAIYLPEEVTAVAGLDDAIVVFSKDSIFLVYGEGPSDQGVGAYTSPRRLPSHVGCIDHRSVVETPHGLFFQSKCGLHLLPRGFGPPVLISGPVQETLATYPFIQSATLCIEQADGSSALSESTVRFICSDAELPTASRLLVYDLRTQAWSVDNVGVELGVSGIWDDLYTFTRSVCSSTNPIRQETLGAYGNLTAFAEMRIGTGELRPFGLVGQGSFCSVQVLTEFREACKLGIECWVDGSSQGAFVLPLPAGGETQGQVVNVEYVPRVRQGTSIRVEVYDLEADSPTGPTEAVVIHGIQIAVEPAQGPRRLPAAYRGP